MLEHFRKVFLAKRKLSHCHGKKEEVIRPHWDRMRVILMNVFHFEQVSNEVKVAYQLLVKYNFYNKLFLIMHAQACI